ncbi:hypothetical protein J3R30DRAFT_930285 [Lentinula aciculospora]|uniref:Uncharacterized protein n=1 Tax=Lentinula aciculospora TaxID=153920 RepID=A0A9W9DWG9_9AGAR|nr:hypothetical protein J3R30DRAFT_930285 [Lentinula aciculospora]
MALIKLSNLVALLIFTSLTVLAFHFILGHGDASGFFDQLSAQCSNISSDEAPYRLPYTGIQFIDKTLCAVVVFFHASFGPDVAPFLTYFLVSVAPIMGHAYFESSRPSRPFLMAYPVIFFQVMQLLSFGATFSVYWMLFVLSGSSSLRSLGPQTMVTKAHAQAIIFGIFIGLIILSGCMIILQDPYITAIWQVFPIVASVATILHLIIRPASLYPESGYKIIRGFYISSFILISSMHITLLTSRGMEEMKVLMLPSINVLPTSTSIELHSLNLLQWDATFGLLSSLLGTLWFGRNVKEIFALLAWNLLASPLVGPGAAFSASALWREVWLHDDLKGSKKE